MTSFAIGYVNDVECSVSWQDSLFRLIDWDMASRQRLVENGIIRVRCPTDGLSAARNEVVRTFLNSKAEWLFWVDTDMGFTPTAFDELLSVADPRLRPIIGALCFMQAEVGTDGMGGSRCRPVCTIFDWVEEDGKRFLRSRPHFPVNTLTECGGTGSACVLVHRSVFEQIRATSGDVWYDRLVNESTGGLVSEDLSFCTRANRPVYVYTKVRTSHLKRIWLQEEDFWNWFQCPPAEQATAVIVPVMKRPGNAEPFMKWFRASTGMATVYVVADGDDTETIAAWEAEGARVLISDRGTTFAKKANYGYEHTEEPWLFLCGDDVRFYPGWLDHAQHVAVRDELSVVATNDLFNPSVKTGEHATHPLIRRAYVDEYGAAWDGPKVLCHEGYRHNFVDNEWTYVARQRGVFGAALASKVEHMHPVWARGADDEVYKKGRFTFDRDRRLFEQRFKEHR